MTNPWLDIPLADYEGHMSLPYVAQAQLLSDIFADALSKYSPRSVAVLGCAGGNGLERVSSEMTERVVGVDLNPEFVQQTRARFDRQVPVLELFVGDIQTDHFAFSPVELVFAGLLFEYVDAEVVLGNTRQMLRPSGTLLTVVQLPSAAIAEVTPSPFAHLSTLSSVMRLVPPERLRQLAEGHGYCETEERTVQASGGKEFQVQEFRLERHSHGIQPTPHGGCD
jgi:ubiquinone/menaquinone biosynthesis C-methylase UbiE